jgi:hypothetical protein
MEPDLSRIRERERERERERKPTSGRLGLKRRRGDIERDPERGDIGVELRPLKDNFRAEVDGLEDFSGECSLEDDESGDNRTILGELSPLILTPRDFSEF